MFRRTMERELIDAADHYPVVTVHGPRQSGKTTLVCSVFPDKPYANLEQTDVRALATSDPMGFLEQFPDGAILDEIQRVPELLSDLQVVVDKEDKKGLFILTGSHQLLLHQSLAGRTALLELLPMSLGELGQAGIHQELDQAIFSGGFPRIHKDHLHPVQAYAGYVETYIERDLRQLITVRDLDLFHRFLQLCAGRIGQILNREGLAGEVGVSAKTIRQWLSILKASHLVFTLPPYFENFGKRAVKSPKLYFCDPGLAASLLGIESVQQLARDPLRGSLVENLVVLELIKGRLNQGLPAKFYFFRDSHQNEVDVIYPRGHDLIPVEIKSAGVFHPSLLRSLHAFRRLAKDRCVDSYLVYTGKAEQTVQGIHLINYRKAEKIV